jgi:hypothetical protein
VVENTAGTMLGNVALVTARGDTLPSYAGATIQIKGTTFQTTSSATGDWKIENIPAGIYTILLTKPGFDTLAFSNVAFRGVGTSYFLSTGIQEIPMDSLVYTVINTTEDSNVNEYEGLISMTGNASGPDSAYLSDGLMAASGGIDQSVSATLTNGQITNLVKGVIGYSEPPDTKGAIVTFRGYMYANNPIISFTNFQRATSPYIVERTLTLP